MTCNQNNCQEPATFRVFWPGKVPPPVYCEEHMNMARRISNAMGCPVSIMHISEEEVEDE